MKFLFRFYVYFGLDICALEFHSDLWPCIGDNMAFIENGGYNLNTGYGIWKLQFSFHLQNGGGDVLIAGLCLELHEMMYF